MRDFGGLVGAILCSVPLFGQASASQTVGELHSALQGDWVGVLEYRDYSQPVTSIKRVDLPTWLTISQGAQNLQTWHFVYDDGPNKTVDETETVRFDPEHGGYSVIDDGKPAQTFQVAGYDTLKSGRGTLVLTGNGTDAGKPAELKQTLTIRRNLLEVLEETRPAGSQDAFAFRHLYRFVRREAPALTK